MTVPKMKVPIPIPEWMIQDLIAYGLDRDLDALKRLLPYGELNRLHWSSWREAMKDASEDDLFAVLRAMVTLESEERWLGGSVAAGIWLGRLMLEKYPHRWTEVAKWIDQHGKNTYLTAPGEPHSHMDEDAWNAYVGSERRRWVLHHVRQERAQADAEAQRKQRAAEGRAQQKHMRSLQIARVGERSAHLQQLQKLSPVERLRHVIHDGTVTLSYYPTVWGMVNHQVLDQLDEGELVVLANRCRLKSSRNWRTVGCHLRLYASQKR